MAGKSKNNGHDRDYGAEVLDGAIDGLTGGVNLAVGESAINNALLALEQQTKVLVKAKYDPSKPELVARSAAHTAKVVDEITRLVAFAKGGPDSRVEQTQTMAEQAVMDKLLAALTNEQLAQLRQWRNENKERDASDQTD